MKSNSNLRRAAIVTGGIAGVIVVAVAAVYFLVDPNQFRPQIQDKLQTALGRPVKLGSLGLGVLPLSVQVSDVQIDESPEFPTGRPFAKLKRLAVNASLLGLLRGKLAIDSLVLKEPEIELARNAEGKWNWETIGTKESAAAKPEEKSSGSSALSLSELRIENASVALSTLGKPESRTVYGPINVDVNDFGPGQKFSYTVSLELPGLGHPKVELAGTAGPMPEGDSLTTPLDAELKATGIKWSSLAKGLQMRESPGFDATTNLNAKLSSSAGMLAAKGAVQLSEFQLGGRQWNQPFSISFDVRHNLQSGEMQLNPLSVRAGSVPIDVTGKLLTKPAPGTADLRVKIPNSDLHVLLPLVALAGAGLGDGMDLAGRISADLHLTSSLDSPNYNGTLDLQNLSVKTAGLAQPLRVPALRVSLTPDAVKAGPFHAEAGKTRLDASLGLQDYSTKSPRIDFQLKGDSLDVDELQKLASSGSATPKQESKKKSSGSSANSLAKWRGQGSVSIGRLTSQQLVLEQVRTDATLNGGVLRLSPLSANVFNGTHQGSLQVDLRQDPPLVTLESKLQKADVNRALTTTSSIKDRIFGLLASNIAGSFRAADTDQIVNTLNGSVNVDITNGRLAGFNLLNKLSSVGKFSSFANQAQNFTQFTSLKGQINIKDGVGSTDNLVLAYPDGTLSAVGTVNLVAQTIDMKVTAVLNQAFSKQVGGTGIGGYLSTALANRSGELVIPALVTGSLNDPKFAPDAAAMAKMKVQGLLPSTGKPGALVEGLQGAISGKKPTGKSLLEAVTGSAAQKQQAGATSQSGEASKATSKQPNAAETVQGVLDLFKKKKTPSSPKQ